MKRKTLIDLIGRITFQRSNLEFICPKLPREQAQDGLLRNSNLKKLLKLKGYQTKEPHKILNPKKDYFDKLPLVQTEEKSIKYSKTTDNPLMVQDNQYPFLIQTFKKSYSSTIYDYIQQLMEQLQNLIQEKLTNSPLIIGLQGMQGVGKTTLGLQLQQFFASKNISFESVSIDDFYLSYEQREKLNKQKFKWRGPPGTHDYQNIIECLQQFKAGKEIQVPIFNKALQNGQGDRVGTRIIKAQVLLFEGWFAGYRSSQLEKYLQKKSLKDLNLFQQSFDEELAYYFNEQLKHYEIIWDSFDFLVQIKPNPFELSLKWRLEAEQQMRVNTGNGMSDQQIKEFVLFFWNCLHPQIYNDLQCEIIIEVNAERQYKVL